MKCIVYILLGLFTTEFVCSQTPGSVKPVKIGFLIQESDFSSARHGAELAVKMANENGGLSGRPFEAIVKGMEGPWGTGSKQAVDLIFEDEVWALAGSHDGRNAHLIEQAATKSLIVYVSAWSSDPSLSQAFVPWFFNCVPDDLRQAEILLEALFPGANSGNVFIITDNSYESKQACNSFLRKINESGIHKAIQLHYDKLAGNPDAFTKMVYGTGVQKVVLFCNPSATVDIVRMSKKAGSSLKLYAPIYISNEDVLSDSEIKELDGIIKVPCGIWSSAKFASFNSLYLKTYGKKPGMVACYAFDAMSLLIHAIISCKSSEREDIQKALYSIRYDGVTGQISFGNLGNRMSASKVSVLQNGVPADILLNKR